MASHSIPQEPPFIASYFPIDSEVREGVGQHFSVMDAECRVSAPLSDGSVMGHSDLVLRRRN